MSKYHEPIDKFLGLGRPEGNRAKDWMNYVEAYNLTNEHIPDLIKAVLDNSNEEFLDPDSFAAIHAWRALGQLQAVAAIPALIEVIKRDVWDDWGWEEMPDVIGLIGEAALEPVYQSLLKRRNSDTNSITFISCLENIAQTHPDLANMVIEKFVEILSEPKKNDATVNGFIIHSLVKLEAAKALPLIEAAYQSKNVDLMVRGRFKDVLIDFGLPIPDDLEEEEELDEPFISPPFFLGRDYEQDPPMLSEKAYEKKKNKRQMAKKSKQINRKKKKK